MTDQRDREAILCEPCAVELFLLEEASDFPEENVEMYANRYGLYDGIVRIWPEVAPQFGYTTPTAMAIGEDMNAWLWDHSPYRKADRPEPARRCPYGAKHL